MLKHIFASMALVAIPSIATSSIIDMGNVRYDLSTGTYSLHGWLQWGFEFPWTRGKLACESSIDPGWCDSLNVPESYVGGGSLVLGFSALAGPEGVKYHFEESFFEPGDPVYTRTIATRLNEGANRIDVFMGFNTEKHGDLAGTHEISGLAPYQYYANDATLQFVRRDMPISAYSFYEALGVSASTYVWRVVDLAPDYSLEFSYRGSSVGGGFAEIFFIGEAPPLARETVAPVPLPAPIAGSLLALGFLSALSWVRRRSWPERIPMVRNMRRPLVLSTEWAFR